MDKSSFNPSDNQLCCDMRHTLLVKYSDSVTVKGLSV